MAVTDELPGDAPPGGWPRPRSVYLHVPFCRHRCGYCNFSVVAGRPDLVPRFLDALERELSGLGRPTVETVFVGGGTPTQLDPQSIDRLLSSIKTHCEIDSEAEWTVEANPEDLDRRHLEVLQHHGVNRISLGVQSFNDQKLRRLERSHSGQAARRAVEAAARVATVSIDLIFAAPEESMAQWESDLDTAVALPIHHLSTYTLTYEKGTAFWGRRRRGLIRPVDETREVEMYRLARNRVATSGFDPYEISNASRPGFRCRHNVNYWRGGGWYAVGPGAARFVQGRREVNHRSPTTYLKRIESGRSPTAECEVISTEQYAREISAFGIRMSDGIDLTTIKRTTGVDIEAIAGDAIDRAMRQGLLDRAAGRLCLTERGVLFADTVAAEFL